MSGIRPPQPIRPAVSDSRHLSKSTLHDWLHKAANETPDNIAVLWRGGEMNYGALYEASRKFAAGLLSIGLRKGDVIGIQLPNIPEFLIAYYAITMIGGVVALLHVPYRIGELVPLVTHAKARAIICTAATERHDAPAMMAELKARVACLEFIIVGDGEAAGYPSMEELSRNNGGSTIENRTLPSDPVVLAFTSGTSAAPKCIVRNYATLLGNHIAISNIYGIDATERIFSAPPFTHIFGICCANLALFTSSSIVLMPSFTPIAFAEAAEISTAIFAGPAHIAACLKSDAFQEKSFSSIRFIGIAGSACPPELPHALKRFVPNASIGGLFGMTETVMSMVTPFSASENIRFETVGVAIPGLDIRVRSSDGATLAAGEEGELEFRGYCVISEYFENPSATREAFTEDGWFKSGDLAIIDKDGNVSITGRIKDIVNRGGVKFNPIDIERIMNSHPAVAQAAIVPIHDEVYGEKACLFVTLQPGHSLNLHGVQEHLRNNEVAKVKWPEALEVISEMPMTPTRKIIKNRLACLRKL